MSTAVERKFRRVRLSFRFIRAKVSFGNSKDSQREAPPKAHVYYWFGNKVICKLFVLNVLETRVIDSLAFECGL